jgi:glycosyltransferase involved in cell wall biosynthesis
MIPVFEPNAYFIEALRSVLEQDLGPGKMQIAVVDDASQLRDVEPFVKEIDTAGRVEIYRANKNQGLAGNWNRCIRLARGEIVHILHQDDVVADGIYAKMLPPLLNRPLVGMAFCRHAYIDDQGRVTHRTPRERWRAGIVANWLQRIAEKQRIQCASVLVRRSTYERLGGYRTDLCYALDWEMWVRIASRYAVWFEPKLLASYRRHSLSESHRLLVSGRTTRDTLMAIESFAQYLPSNDRERLQNAAYTRFVRRSLKEFQRIDRPSQSDAAQLLQPVKMAIDKIDSRSRESARFRELSAELERKWSSDR